MFTVLSALDARARSKGSRDPLGAEAIWSFMGRRLVGNLTTVTASLDNFIVALLCCEFGNEAGTLEAIQERYLRFEQLAAYLKLCKRPTNDGVLGITRARANFATGSVQFGAGKAAQLLADQRSYGLWGLYSSALESAGLIEGERRRLTSAGQRLVALIVDRLGARCWRALHSLAQLDRVNASRIEALAGEFDAMLVDATLRATIVDALLAHQRDCRLQGELFGLAQRYLDANEESSPRQFCETLLQPGAASADMQITIGRIRDLDPVLKRADVVMAWLQGKADTPLDELASTLAPYLAGLAHDASWRDVADLPYRAYLEEFHHACVRGDAQAVIAAILAQNRRVMAARGGAAWLDTDAGRLVVRVRNDRPEQLTDLGSASGPWRHTYFMGAFLSICRQGRPCRP